MNRNPMLALRIRGFGIPTLMMLGAMLTGCATSAPPLSYYLLHDVTENNATRDSVSQNNPNALVLINRVVLPDYLKQRGLVFQTSDTGIHIATDHLWAEPMDEGLTKRLRDSLTHHNLELITHAMGAQEVDVYLTLRIDDFIASHQGDIILRGEYFLSYADEVDESARFHVSLPLPHDGFDTSVKVMRQALATLADKIASDINAK
ncbi:hypothetical protein GTH32_06885 [Alteromonas sp. 345S023]|uniref:ABC-type transport auxiliary lipoprotein component domain-containing protein n=1 Tax=Alteromonas profundi TaxID=2696062 RepID=A0A7X5LKC1_9ALTE|nr:ABC-type transport auxiliary lipoprotein family protein [Alteromonas profundi]NDV90924.1 hypothetical protein [Alteromonas profundi]